MKGQRAGRALVRVDGGGRNDAQTPRKGVAEWNGVGEVLRRFISIEDLDAPAVMRPKTLGTDVSTLGDDTLPTAWTVDADGSPADALVVVRAVDERRRNCEAGGMPPESGTPASVPLSRTGASRRTGRPE